MKPKHDWSRAAEMAPEDLARALDDDHDEVDDNPELTEEQLVLAKPGEPPKRRPGQRGPGKHPAKVSVTLRLEPEILAAFKMDGPGWQARMRRVLDAGAPRAAGRTRKTG